MPDDATATCRHCSRLIARSGQSGLWWAIDGLPVDPPGCHHEPDVWPDPGHTLNGSGPHE